MGARDGASEDTDTDAQPTIGDGALGKPMPQLKHIFAISQGSLIANTGEKSGPSAKRMRLEDIQINSGACLSGLLSSVSAESSLQAGTGSVRPFGHNTAVEQADPEESSSFASTSSLPSKSGPNLTQDRTVKPFRMIQSDLDKRPGSCG